MVRFTRSQMLQLTKRTEYGLIAMVHLAQESCHSGPDQASDRAGDRTVGAASEPISAREIAEAYGVPKRLLAEVMKDLGRAGLVHSTRGAQGGYELAHAAEDLSLGQIVSALEGAPSVSSCETIGSFAGATKSCDVAPRCPIRSPLHRIRNGIWRLMEGTSLRALAGVDDIVPTELPAQFSSPNSSMNSPLNSSLR